MLVQFEGWQSITWVLPSRSCAFPLKTRRVHYVITQYEESNHLFRKAAGSMVTLNQSDFANVKSKVSLAMCDTE